MCFDVNFRLSFSFFGVCFNSVGLLNNFFFTMSGNTFKINKTLGSFLKCLNSTPLGPFSKTSSIRTQKKPFLLSVFCQSINRQRIPSFANAVSVQISLTCKYLLQEF